ncbi:MAG: hypothetical protein ACJ71S_06495 [Acidobacteriaceae bacterium]|jgi:hypothetical protein
MSEYRGKDYVMKKRPRCHLEDVSMNGTWYEVIDLDADGEDVVMGCGRTPMDAWSDAAMEIEREAGSTHAD